ncbi:hypothetical protein QL996_04375 [Planococcus sp. APC 4015]|nr:hypothetical protein [Planococcus sp. APC 4015]
MTARRPIGVTIVVIVALVIALLQLLTGVVLLVGGGVLIGVVVVVIGVLTLAVTVGVLRGSGSARLIFALVLLMNVGSAIYLLFAHPSQGWSAVLSLGFAAVALALLFSPRANSYFAS